MSEVLVYHDDEAIYFEHKGKDSGIVRFTFEMIEGLKMVEDEEVPDKLNRGACGSNCQECWIDELLRKRLHGGIMVGGKGYDLA